MLADALQAATALRRALKKYRENRDDQARRAESARAAKAACFAIIEAIYGEDRGAWPGWISGAKLGDLAKALLTVVEEWARQEEERTRPERELEEYWQLFEGIHGSNRLAWPPFSEPNLRNLSQEIKVLKKAVEDKKRAEKPTKNDKLRETLNFLYGSNQEEIWLD